MRTPSTRSPRAWVAAALIAAGASLMGCAGTAATPQPTAAAPTGSTTSAATPANPTPANPTAANPRPATPTPAATESNPPGDIPDNQAFVAFTVPGTRVSVKVPEGWARSTAGPTTVFSDKLNRIQITGGQAATAPTTASVTRDDVAKLAQVVPAFTLGQVSTTRRNAGPIVLVTYQGDSAQDPVTGKVVRDAFERYIYYRKGQRLDLTLSGPTNADNVDPWRTVSDSVAWR